MLTEVLRDAGHDVVAAYNGEQALSLLAGVDAALVDLHLPGECGEALIARLREARATLPVILLTGDVRRSRPATAGPLRALDVMIKPLDIDELAKVLNRALSSSPRSAAAPE
jgi:DNA-binding response OmpR family regulator